MDPIISLALLIADLNSQVRALQQDNAELRATNAELHDSAVAARAGDRE